MLTRTIPSYLYTQYNDDAALQAFVDAYNELAQEYVTFFATVGLPVYPGLSEPLLDWAAAGLYGLTRPVVATSPEVLHGPYNSWAYNTLPYDAHERVALGNHDVASDDIFKRYMTWWLYRGDGRVVNTRWIKRRVTRFLTGSNGSAPNVDATYGVSVTYGGGGEVQVQIYPQFDPVVVAAFHSLVVGGMLSLPFQNTFNVVT